MCPSVYPPPLVLVTVWLFVFFCVHQLRACSPDASPEQLDAYSAKIALCFNAYYNIYVDNATLQATQVLLCCFATCRRRYYANAIMLVGVMDKWRTCRFRSVE